MTDSSVRLSIAAAIDVFQDIASEHAVLLGVDGIKIKKEYNAFWVITRTKLKFYRRPHFLEDITVKTWPNKPKGVRCVRNYTVSAGGELVFAGKSEWAVLDIESRSLRRLDTIGYPYNLDYIDEKALTDPFLKPKAEFGDEDFVFSRKVMYSDTDMSRHTNNASYCKFIADTFDPEFFEKNECFELDIRYISESKAGDVLSIYKKQLDGGYLFGIKKEDGSLLTTVLLKIV